ncbi:unnamed protein product [Oikopleura dioica]|uniref:RING-type domain-containing protein n=1 Tax=Oikopleura dioica TaxID=34765 RepID=E4Y1G7_OIKDI|nr:unnamed protein product [Oikopleura dioica]
MYGRKPDGTVPCIQFFKRQNPFALTHGDILNRKSLTGQPNPSLEITPDGRIVKPDPTDIEMLEARLNLLTTQFLEEEKNEQCSICLDGLTEAVSLPCDHSFHASCIRTWLTTKNTCPLCQKIIE